MDYNLPGSSVHRIFWARILGWVAISLSRGLSQSWHQTRVPCISSIDRQILYNCTISDYVGLWLLPSLGNFQTVFIQILFHLYALFYFWSSENKEIRFFFFLLFHRFLRLYYLMSSLLSRLGNLLLYRQIHYFFPKSSQLFSGTHPISFYFNYCIFQFQNFLILYHIFHFVLAIFHLFQKCL